MEGSENVIEDLPLVGSEIEVTTEASFESNFISTLKLGILFCSSSLIFYLEFRGIFGFNKL